MKKLLKSIVDWAKFPSTWKGLITLLTVAGVTLSPEQAEAIAVAGVAVVGVIATFFSDSDVK